MGTGQGIAVPRDLAAKQSLRGDRIELSRR
jgi:hypothetical protein